MQLRLASRAPRVTLASRAPVLRLAIRDDAELALPEAIVAAVGQGVAAPLAVRVPAGLVAAAGQGEAAELLVDLGPSLTAAVGAGEAAALGGSAGAKLVAAAGAGVAAPLGVAGVSLGAAAGQGEAAELDVSFAPPAPTITSPLDDAVVPGDTVDITAAAADAEVGVTIGVWRSATPESADAVEVEGYTGTTGVDGTATISAVPKA